MSHQAIATPALLPLPRRVLKHPRLMHYHRLIVLVLAVNAAVVLHHLGRGDWALADGSALSALSDLALLNLAVAILIRQPWVLNALFALAGRAPRGWPLRLRWAISKVAHVGGLHVGAALAGTLAFLAFTWVAVVARSRDAASVSVLTLALTGAIAVIVVVIVVCAAPAVRSRAHDRFEMTHRFGGWSAIALLWALSVELAVSGPGAGAALPALASSWPVWLVLGMTAAIAAPWLRLRRVSVTVERPSAHAAIVSFDYGVSPAVASAVGISRSPLGQWHSFATVRSPARAPTRARAGRR